jgi:hypothetical protein
MDTIISSFTDLVSSMRNRTWVRLNGVEGIVNAITAEDGSGRSWNVTLNPAKGGKDVTVYWHEVNSAHTLFVLPNGPQVGICPKCGKMVYRDQAVMFKGKPHHSLCAHDTKNQDRITWLYTK